MKRNIFLIFIFLLISTGGNFGKNFTVVIDAGHGGKDPGAVRGKIKEKDINLAIALNLGKLIENNFSDVNVVYTRKSDLSVALDKRADIANKAKGNLFISIHTNSTDAKSTAALGADTYILGLARSEENKEVQKRENSVILLEDNYKERYEGFDPNSPESYIIFEFMTNKYMEQSLEIASSIQKNFKTVAKRNDRGVRQAGFLVLREVSMPSILIELGFINNPTEAKYLTSSIGQRSMASAIFAGFKAYKKEFDKKQGSRVIAANTTNQKEQTKTATVTKPTATSTVSSKSKQENKQETKQTAKSEEFINKPKQDPVMLPPKKEITAKPTTEKPVVTKQPVIEEQPAISLPANQIEYRIQFLMSATKIADGSPRFKGLSPVGFYIDNGAYKYTYGSTTDRNEAIRIQQQVRSKFKDAFIIELRDGKRIK